MRLLPRAIQIALLSAFITAHAHSQQLRWEAEELTLTPSPADAAAVGHFKFRNVGKSEARISAATSSCGCTTATWTQAAVAPGESGEVAVTFTFGARQGPQEKSVLVESNDPERPQAVLKMNVAIPEVIQVSPTFLFWQAGQPLEPRSILVKVFNGFPVKALTVTSSNPLVSTRVEPAQPGAEFRIVVTPSKTDQALRAALTITSDYPQENPKRFNATIRVEGKPRPKP